MGSSYNGGLVQCADDEMGCDRAIARRRKGRIGSGHVCSIPDNHCRLRTAITGKVETNPILFSESLWMMKCSRASNAPLIASLFSSVLFRWWRSGFVLNCSLEPTRAARYKASGRMCPRRQGKEKN